MSPHPAWRGQRRVRVTLEISDGGARITGMQPLDGPAIQRTALEGTHVAQVTIGGATALIHSFDDPLRRRGASRPDKLGHSYTRSDLATVHIDVPIPAEGIKGEIAIRIVDLSKVRARPIDLDGMQRLLGSSKRSGRIIADITAKQLIAHPDWARLRLPGAPGMPASGRYEIYVDRSGKYRWRLQHPDGHIIAQSGQGYRERKDCEADLRWVKQRGAAAPVRSLDLK